MANVSAKVTEVNLKLKKSLWAQLKTITRK